MMDHLKDWTPEDSKHWASMLDHPILRKGMAIMHRRFRVTGSLQNVAPGYDMLVLAAGAHHQSVGRQEVLDMIETMGAEKNTPKPMPQPFTAEARGEKPSEEEIPR